METLDVIKVVAEGPVTSFRYPYLIQGRQPTFEMPPPATIYGHICSTCGEQLDPASLRFAYHFTHQGRFVDYEYLYFGEPNEKKLAPFRRDLLFNPRLTLYIDRPDLLEFFLSPRCVVTLGRSQDLMVYTQIERVTLVRAERAYFEGTLLTLEDATLLQGGYVAVSMPRYINSRREPDWEQYAMLKRPVLYPLVEEASSPGGFDAYADDAVFGFPATIEEVLDFWVDPHETNWPRHPDVPRGIIFHTFTRTR